MSVTKILLIPLAVLLLPWGSAMVAPAHAEEGRSFAACPTGPYITECFRVVSVPSPDTATVHVAMADAHGNITLAADGSYQRSWAVAVTSCLQAGIASPSALAADLALQKAHLEDRLNRGGYYAVFVYDGTVPNSYPKGTLQGTLYIPLASGAEEMLTTILSPSRT